jgi:hypothetical protein
MLELSREIMAKTEDLAMVGKIYACVGLWTVVRGGLWRRLVFVYISGMKGMVAGEGGVHVHEVLGIGTLGAVSPFMPTEVQGIADMLSLLLPVSRQGVCCVRQFVSAK